MMKTLQNAAFCHKLISNFKFLVVFQLDFAYFFLEESDRCLYDSLSVLGDVEGTEEIGRMDELQLKPCPKTNLTSFISPFSH